MRKRNITYQEAARIVAGCPPCRGTGEVPWRTDTNKTFTGRSASVCTECNGSGNQDLVLRAIDHALACCAHKLSPEELRHIEAIRTVYIKTKKNPSTTEK